MEVPLDQVSRASICSFDPFLVLRGLRIGCYTDNQHGHPKDLQDNKFHDLVLALSADIGPFVNFFNLVILQVEISLLILLLEVEIARDPVVHDVEKLEGEKH